MTTKGQFVEKPSPSAVSVDADGNGANPPTGPETPQEASMWNVASPWVHGALGVASFVPGLSVLTGALDATIFAAEGNRVEAALAVVSMIPGGKAVTSAAKAVKGVVRAAEEASSLARIAKGAIEAKNVVSAAQTAKEVGGGANLANEVHAAADVVRKMKASRPSRSGKDEVTVAGVKRSAAKSISLKNKKEIPPSEANNGFEKPPYSESTKIIEGVTAQDEKFVRLYDGEVSRSMGRWVMPASEVKGLSAAQIQEKFALPQLPKYIIEVNVPAGTKLRVGEAGAISGWGAGGGTQIQLLDNIPMSSFTNARPFP